MKLLCLMLAIAFTIGLLITPAWSDDTGAQKVLKEGIVGAGVGAIAAGASGGKAGKGALIGAGANIAGGVIMDALSGPSTPAPQQVQPQPVYQQPAYQQPVVVAPSPYQQGYDAGYQKGFEVGYEKGYQNGLTKR